MPAKTRSAKAMADGTTTNDDVLAPGLDVRSHDMGITTRCSPDGNVLSALGGAPGADGADKGKVTKNPKSPFEVMADALGNVFSDNSKVTKPRLASLSATDDGVD